MYQKPLHVDSHDWFHFIDMQVKWDLGPLQTGGGIIGIGCNDVDYFTKKKKQLKSDESSCVMIQSRPTPRSAQ